MAGLPKNVEVDMRTVTTNALGHVIPAPATANMTAGFCWFDPKAFATKAFAKDTPRAEEILRWMLKEGVDRDGFPRQGFMGDMVMSCSDFRGLTERQWAAVVRSFHRAEERAEAGRERNKHRHTVGAIGEVITVPVKLISRKATENAFGGTFLHIFHDLSADENVIKCWSTARDVVDLDIGQSALLRGKVTSHSEWNGCPETIVNRPKLIK